MTPALFSRFELRALTLANRIVVSPMCQYSAVDGCATDWHLAHWTQLLQSGAGMFTIEATAVSATGRITRGCLGLYDDACEAAIAQRLAIARRNAPPIPVAIQLAHAGRKGSSQVPWEGGQLIAREQGGWTPLAPSAIPHLADEPPPAALDAAGIAQIRREFVSAAERSARLGLDALEIHCAHGYLLHEFLSPISNHRHDAYGGSFENRIRFPLEVFAAVRAVWPEAKPMGARISATDWVDGGWTIEDSIALARRLKAAGCDWIDSSSGGISPKQKIPLGPGYQVPLSRQIRRAVSIPTIAVGLITEPKQAETIVASGDADLVALARAMLWDPRWPWHAAAALGAQVLAPPQYWRSAPREAASALANAKLGMR
ncbi:MAG TPA: NADH:flavin oxidoreductase/NADH oxidase [Casimicrobiaceae bacterium]|jgi:2,4-dienoyl-CoA reductase-like NADH-dependent reductase (Old Yellow Enzyme family)|nr:NADH:flavin oxidoreductase/NADH oxidase [Casimicrobiaceae bacterium]